MENIAGVGDKTTHGGMIIAGSKNRKVQGKYVARLGDACTCPIHGKTIITIITQKMPYTDGLPTAHSGAKTACGAMIIKTPFREVQDTSS